MNIFKNLFNKGKPILLTEKEKRRQESIAQTKRIIAPIEAEIRKKGYKIDSLSDLEAKTPIDRIITEILFEWIKKIEDEIVLEWLVSLMSRSKVKIDPEPLFELFENTTDFVRFRIVETIAIKKLKSAGDWIREKLKQNNMAIDPYTSLLFAAAVILPAQESLPYLYKEFEKYPGNVAEAMAVIGGKAELEFLQNKKEWVKENFDWWHDDQMRLAIVKLYRKCKE